MLLEKKELEAHFKKVCGSSYDKEFEGFICRDSFGKLISPEYVTTRFHYVITKHGLRHLRFHDLRHSCASLLLANDIPMKAIQEWLGHSNYAITANLYSHLEYNAKVISAETIFIYRKSWKAPKLRHLEEEKRICSFHIMSLI